MAVRCKVVQQGGSRWRGCVAVLLVVLASLLAPAAWAQLGGMPPLRTPAPLGGVLGGVNHAAGTTLDAANNLAPALHDLRTATARDLRRRHPDQLDVDPAGQLVRRGELLWNAPSAEARRAAREAGFTELREEALPELDLATVVLRVPPRMPLDEAARLLRALDAQATVDFNHVYLRSGAVQGPASEPAPAPAPAATALPPSAPNLAGEPPATRRVGLVDGGVDARHPALAASQVVSWGCDGRVLPSEHGTAVASLLVGQDRVGFSGAWPGAVLYAADVYCNQPAGGAADEVVRALAWLVRQRVPVINISLVGPPNALLARAVAAVQRRGHVLVAAVGNDGPAAPPLYPAAYPGVVGVSAVLPSRRVLPEAAQGPQVMFTAPGAELAAAQPGGGYAAVRGTSFAAPVVAGLLAGLMAEAPPQPASQLDAAAAALARLAQSAQDLGAPGRDPVYGVGLVGEGLRTPPERVAARRR